MKKFFAILLAAMMVISLAACGEQKEPEKTKAPETAEEKTEAAEEIETPSETEAPSDTPEETEEQKVGGTLKAGNPEVSPLATYTVEGDTLIIDGELKWYSEDLDAWREAGNYVAVIVTAPEIYDLEFLIANTTFVFDDGDPMGWGEVTTEEVYIGGPLRFDANTRSYTITFNWSEEHTQVLTVKLADTAILQPAQ
ncbi:MAG: lipoprotein [Lachnospiraceae bacterium]|jgi:predicted small lipoprotein YifL